MPTFLCNNSTVYEKKNKKKKKKTKTLTPADNRR